MAVTAAVVVVEVHVQYLIFLRSSVVNPKNVSTVWNIFFETVERVRSTS